MDIKFHCRTCAREFFVGSRYLAGKTNIVCPNCNNVFSENSTHLLLEAIKKLNECQSDCVSKWHIEFETVFGNGDLLK